MEAKDKIAKDLEDAASRHNSKIFCWHINNLRGVVNPDLSQLKIEIGPQLLIRKELKRDEQNILGIC